MSKTKPKPKPRPRPKTGGGYRFPVAVLFAGIAGAMFALGCDRQPTNPDKVWDEVQRYSCYGLAGGNAKRTLNDLCPTSGTDAEKAVQMAACPALPAVLESLDAALLKCDEP